MKVLVPLAKNISAPLEITALLQQLMQGFKRKYTVQGLVSNEEMNGITKIVQVLDCSYVLLKGVFLIILFGALGASLLRNLLTGKEIVKAGSRNKKEKGIARAGYGDEMGF